MLKILLSAAFTLATGLAAQSGVLTVVIETSAGVIEVAVDPVHAPITTANFLRYVEAGMYDEGRFHRAVRRDNQARQDVLIEVIQGGRDPASAKTTRGFGPIPLERTSVTTLTHLDGAISMARGNTADSGSSDFFLCVGPQPALDFGGARAADGQGFAAFGRVMKGMDVVRRIQAGRTNEREQLLEPIRIVRVYRQQ